MTKKILVVGANYYKDILADLTIQAKAVLLEKYSKETIKDKWIKVPGVFEIPVVLAKNIKKYDGFIVLGCVIKGETPHFDFISQATINAIMKLSVENNKPIGNGIITCLNKEQAVERADSMKKDKGGEAAKAVLSVLGILDKVKK